jgi:hypothetical protein
MHFPGQKSRMSGPRAWVSTNAATPENLLAADEPTPVSVYNAGLVSPFLAVAKLPARSGASSGEAPHDPKARHRPCWGPFCAYLPGRFAREEWNIVH